LGELEKKRGKLGRFKKEIFQELFLRQVEVSWQISGKKEREYPAWGTERTPR